MMLFGDPPRTERYWVSMDSASLPHAPSTLVDLLQWRALHQPDRRAYTFLRDGETEGDILTYHQLEQHARAIGVLLREHGAVGTRALLLYPPGLEYSTAFFACLYAGIVAVPAYPPNPARLERTLPRLHTIAAAAQPTLVLTTTALLPLAQVLAAQDPAFHTLRWFATDVVDLALADAWQRPDISTNSLAFLQYTSGSTAAPKGVMITHANLLHNLALIQQSLETNAESRGVFWLPFYHDMGLIGGLLQPIYCGGTTVLMSPVEFLQRPLRMLQAISRYRATISGGPNFAYDLCVRKATPDQCADLDLSSWRVAFTGAEPVRAATLERFAQTFAPFGFDPRAFYPCYGLAEATLLVSGARVGASAVVAKVDRSALEHNQVLPAEAESTTLVLASSGQPRQTTLIVDPATRLPCPPACVGEIWVASESVAQGYWNQPDVIAQTFGAILADGSPGSFLRTGDLGFIQDGELFVTGRIKDLLIIRGRNHYPQDIELTVEQCHPALRPGCGAAFSIEVEGEERLVLVHEVERQQRKVPVEEVAAAIRQAVAAQHELHVATVALLRPGTIPKTSSGKIQRHACRAGFLTGTLELIGQSSLAEEEEAVLDPAATLTRETLLAAEPSARLGLLGAYLQAQVARVLRQAPAQLSTQQPLSAAGLDSLMAVELQHAIETDLGVVLAMVDFLHDRSIEQLAADLLTQLDSAPTPRLRAAAPNTADQPLTPGQQALWFLHQLDPAASAAYHIVSAVRIRGALDVDALRRSFQRLVERHPALRTRFAALNGVPMQQIQVQAELNFGVQAAVDWSTAELEERLRAEAQRPFDLEQGGLLRVQLFACAPEEHVLLVVVHHIVADLWSLALLTAELGRIYPTERRGSALDLAPPALAYTDYVRWQAEMLAGPTGAELGRYWQQQLADAVPVLNLPTDFARPAVQGYRGDVYRFALDAALTSQLKALATANGTTLFTLLLAAFAVLLSRYSRQEQFLIGTPTAGRSRAELTDLVGYFVNPVALRVDLGASPSFRALLEQLRQTTLAAFAHQDYPFVNIVERLQPARDTSRSPLFQVMFAWQKAHVLDEAGLTALALGDPGAQLQVGGLCFEAMELAQRVAQFDLSLAVGEVAGSLVATLEYNTDLFAASTMQRMAQHWRNLLAAIVAAPQCAVHDLPLLSASEQQQLLLAWNDTQADYPATACVHTLVAAQAQRTPQALAVVHKDQRLSYAELDAQAERLARHLHKLGVGPETVVALCIERSPAMMVGILGILKAGAAYLPMDPAHPPQRLAYMLSHSRVQVLVTQEHLRNRLPHQEMQVLCIDRDSLDGSVDGAALDIPAAPVQPDNAACIIYTSGSTGHPKGVVLTHGGIVNLVSSFLRSYEPGPQDRILPLSSLAYASFVGEIFPLLCAGGAIVLPTDEEMLDFEAFCAVITRQAVTMLSTVPALIARLNARSEPLPRLRLVLCGGEALTYGQIDRLLATVTISNGYGLTETTVCSTFYTLEPQASPLVGAVPIGHPLINTQTFILDPHMRAVPLGVPGELYIGGDGLARGYLNDPDLTAERFVPNPFYHVAGGSLRLYRTGDLARYLPDGTIEFLGRIDQQVKLRGFRIELSEIESTLRQHPAVREAVVVLRADSTGEQRLVAYVGLRANQSALDAAAPSNLQVELRIFLRERLPDYMIPAAFVLLEVLPLTPNGKIDMLALPAPDTQRPDLGTVYLAPQSELERHIAAVWQEALQVEKLSVHDNFFDLGGHSLLLVQVHSRLREEFSHLALIDMFKYPTISTLAAHLSQKQAVAPAPDDLHERARKQKEFRDRRKQLLRNHE